MSAQTWPIAEASISPLVPGAKLELGNDFSALSFKEQRFAGLMDPIVMADHYTMTGPTFGPHPHAGMSAVSLLFEDSLGAFRNRDSLGNDIDLQAGDLYWLVAGSGAVHDEAPRPGARTHGLQLFINLPEKYKSQAPQSLHVRAEDMPVLTSDHYRVRVVLGESGDLSGASSPALPTTILDGQLNDGATFIHPLSENHSAWIYTVRGSLQIDFGNDSELIPAGHAVSLTQEVLSNRLELHLQAREDSHFILITSQPVRETFIQRGPFVMSTPEALDQVEADYAAGKLGSIEQGQ